MLFAMSISSFAAEITSDADNEIVTLKEFYLAGENFWKFTYMIKWIFSTLIIVFIIKIYPLIFLNYFAKSAGKRSCHSDSSKLFSCEISALYFNPFNVK